MVIKRFADHRDGRVAPESGPFGGVDSRKQAGWVWPKDVMGAMAANA
jgi:hypothetical protein